MDFVDRILTCTDCGGEFIFTAGEQLFFLDKQFKNDPKRCKPCKSRRGAHAAGATDSGGLAAAGISRTETRTVCSECGIETTVPFKPTQGRPVLCRQCFKNKSTPSTSAAHSAPVEQSFPIEQSSPASAPETVCAPVAPPSQTDSAAAPATTTEFVAPASSAHAAVAAETRRKPQSEFSAVDVSMAV